MKKISLLTVVLLASTSARAEILQAGPSGALFCENPKHISEYIQQRAAGKATRTASMSSCRILPEGFKISATHSEIKNDLKSGVGFAVFDNQVRTGGFVLIPERSPQTGKPSLPPQPEPSTQPKEVNANTLSKLVNPPEAAIFTQQSTPSSSQEKIYKVVSPTDVRNTPTKWVGRDIEFKDVQVYWVEDEDVRFLTGEAITVFAVKPRGDSASLSYFKTQCETTREAMSRKCNANIRFSYYLHDEDTPSGLAKRTIIITSDLEVIRLQRR